MTRSELLDAVKSLFAAKGSEKEINALLRRLENEFPYSHVVDLIFYPDKERNEEEVVEEVLRRERDRAGVIALPSRY
jgi:hypothetical protein